MSIIVIVGTAIILGKLGDLSKSLLVSIVTELGARVWSFYCCDVIRIEPSDIFPVITGRRIKSYLFQNGSYKKDTPCHFFWNDFYLYGFSCCKYWHVPIFYKSYILRKNIWRNMSCDLSCHIHDNIYRFVCPHFQGNCDVSGTQFTPIWWSRTFWQTRYGLSQARPPSRVVEVREEVGRVEEALVVLKVPVYFLIIRLEKNYYHAISVIKIQYHLYGLVYHFNNKCWEFHKKLFYCVV